MIVLLQYFFQDYVSQGHDTYDSLYCVAQHAGHVLPRLYLMIICGSCAMKADPSTIPSYLSDLLDFCKGIQHPMRGLFLRSFLNTSVRALLPDVAGVQANAFRSAKHMLGHMSATKPQPSLSVAASPCSVNESASGLPGL